MSGVAPRLAKAAFDPLMNPGDAAPAEEVVVTGSLALSQQPTEALRRLALAPAASSSSDAQAGGDDEEDVPAQSMSDFLGGSSAASALFDDESPNAGKKDVSALFDDADTDDEDAGLSEAARKRRQLKREQLAAAQAAAQAGAAAAQEAQVSVPASPSDVSVQTATAEPAAAAATASSNGLSAASKRAGGKDLFGDDADDSAAQSRGLDGVFIPRGAAEYRTEAEREVAAEVDASLLVEADDGELERLGGGSTGLPSAAAHNGAATSASAAGASAAGAGAGSSAASAAVDDDLDDDLFSFAAPAAKPAASAVDASAPDFDFQQYLASQKAASTTATTGASLFDEDD